MPQPTSSDVHVDAILTNISVAYIQQQGAFIANRVFPSVPVKSSLINTSPTPKVTGSVMKLRSVRQLLNRLGQVTH